LGWCIDTTDNIDDGPEGYSVLMFSSCDPNIDTELADLGYTYHFTYPATDTNDSAAQWNQLNYLLNHKLSGASYWDIQAAMWNIIGGPLPPNSVFEAAGYTGLVYDTNIVTEMTQAALTNAATWQPQCGDVIAVVLAITASDQGGDFPVQLTIIEVPVPCVPCISVTKQIACLQPTNSCGDFTNIAYGFAGQGCSGIDQPAFCYQISITNCGTTPLTNIVVSDNLLGLLDITNFITNQPPILQPGAGATSVFSMSFATNATNTVTVSGDAVLAGTVTNVNNIVVTNGTPVSSFDSAVAVVDTASLSCSLRFFSQNAVSGNNDNNLVLPVASYYSTNNTVTLCIHVCNTGVANLTNVTITMPGLSVFNCTPPGAFNLAAGACQDFQLCIAMVTCPNQLTFNMTVNAGVAPDTNHCAVYDLSGNPIGVCSSCTGTIMCSTNTGCLAGNANLSGTVVLDCNAGSGNITGDSGLAGVTVILYGATNNALATNTTDINGNYLFTSLGAGTYYVVVVPPAGYVETYPLGDATNEVTVTIVVCSNATNVDFGYANTAPPLIIVPPGGYLGCNPTNLPSVASMASNVSAVVSCGTATTNISYTNSTNGCSYSRTFTVIVTDTYGNGATNYVTYTWIEASLSFSSVPSGSNYGCNPAKGTLATVASISNAVVLSDTCSTASYTVTAATNTNNCTVTEIFTILAADSCNDTAAAYVTNTWTNATLSFSSVPAGLNYGCNPAKGTLATVASISNAVVLSDTCSTANYTVTAATNTNNCTVTEIFTILAADACSDTAAAYVTNTWTNATLSFSSVPPGGPLGCNPATASLPTDASVSNAVTFADTCSTVTDMVSHADSTNGCTIMRIFTINAGDACGDTATAYVTNTWTLATLAFNSVPAGTTYGCNPAVGTLPTVTSVSNAVTLNDSCSQATFSVTVACTTNSCAVTQIFTISASDLCKNTAKAFVTNTWTVDATGPMLTGVPIGTNYGCNPTSVPTVASIQSAVKANDTCSSAGISVTAACTTNACAVTQIFTILATNACGSSATAHVTNTWTVDTSPLVLIGVPAGKSLGCNPTNVPTLASVQSAVSSTNDTCSSATVTVSGGVPTTNVCAVTQIFTITATNACGNSTIAYVTNTWTANATAPVLGGVPTGKNLGCNPTNVPTLASVQAAVFSTNDTCSPATVIVSGGVPTTNNCAVTQIFTIIATNACGNTATAYVTNTWTANATASVLGGVPAGKNLGCNPTSVPTLASVQAAVFSTNDTCSPATVIVSGGVPVTNGCGVTQVFAIIATNACGNTATAYVTNTWTELTPTLVTNITYLTNTTIVTNVSFATNITFVTNTTYVTNITVTTNCCTNSICGDFNSTCPKSGWLWLNANCSAKPGSNCTITCQNASVTLTCTNKQVYTYPVPNGTINFSSTCTVATNWFDGTNWHTTLPCAGDSQIFAQGCAIPWQSAFASCQSACWTAVFSCSTPGFTCNWQWGAACYTNTQPACGSIAPKTCLQTSCPNGQYYSSGDQCGTPENHKPYCVGGGSGGGGTNCTGSWCGTSTLCSFGLTTNKTVTPITTVITNKTVTTNTTTTPITKVTTNTTVTSTIAGPVLSGVPAGMNFGCNPASVPTVASVQAEVTASAACSVANVQVTGVNTTNGCGVTQIFTITATNACGYSTTVYVTNTWTADTIPPVISGLPTNTFLGCGITNLPCDSNVLAEVKATDQCGTPSVMVSHQDSTNGCTGTRTFMITATDGCGNMTTTNLIYTWIGLNPELCTNSICAGFNSKNPGSGWLWLNAHCSGNPGSNCTLHCQNASVTLTCGNGKTYTYPVPNGIVNFNSTCTVGTNWFDGTNWNTTLPCAGDSQIFLQGCAIPWQSAFASCQSVCWTGVFSCTAPGQSFSWQWGAACYANSQPAYTNICPKACYQTSCANGQYYSSGDFAGCPENHKPYCVGGGTGLGGSNCTGSWGGTDTTCTFTSTTLPPPVLNGVPANDNLGVNPTNIPTVTSVLAEVTATDTCSSAPVYVTVAVSTNTCSLVTQIFTISATNECGGFALAHVTNTWTTLALTNHCTNTICSSFNSQNPGNGWVWFNCQFSGKPGTNQVLFVCSNSTVTLSCTDGKNYTFPVPNGKVLFSPTCTVGTNWFDGTNWNTTLPCGGDDQIFLTGCAIPWQSDFANCQSVCWSGIYSCSQQGLSFNCQFGAACYNDSLPSYNNICPKACHQTPCQNGQYYNSANYAGCPENHSPYCVGGGTGYGGSNCTGNFSNPGTCNF